MWRDWLARARQGPMKGLPAALCAAAVRRRCGRVVAAGSSSSRRGAPVTRAPLVAVLALGVRISGAAEVLDIQNVLHVEKCVPLTAGGDDRPIFVPVPAAVLGEGSDCRAAGACCYTPCTSLDMLEQAATAG